MMDLGQLGRYLSVNFYFTKEGVFLSQRPYVKDMLQTFGMADYNPTKVPMVENTQLEIDMNDQKVNPNISRRMVDKLIYLVHTKLDITFCVSIVSHFLTNLQLLNLNAVKQIFRYLKCTIDYGIFYKRGGNIELEAFVDVNWASDIEQQRSTSGFIFKIGNSPIPWCEKKQSMVALSLVETEYQALMERTNEVI
jgi:hypothetical protein